VINTHQLNIASISTPIAELRQKFEKIYITYIEKKNSALETFKIGD